MPTDPPEVRAKRAAPCNLDLDPPRTCHVHARLADGHDADCSARFQLGTEREIREAVAAERERAESAEALLSELHALLPRIQQHFMRFARIGEIKIREGRDE